MQSLFWRQNARAAPVGGVSWNLCWGEGVAENGTKQKAEDLKYRIWHISCVELYDGDQRTDIFT
jgi:hypothetical protein